MDLRRQKLEDLTRATRGLDQQIAAGMRGFAPTMERMGQAVREAGLP